MTQDTAHYYLVSYTERAVPIEKKMIFRSFKEIETLLQRLHCTITIEQVDCADFNKPSRPFDEWKGTQEDHKQPMPGQTLLYTEETQEEKINALEALKISRDG
jgi:hypothetical protein